MSWAIEERTYSQRRACGLIGLAPKTCRYVWCRSDDADDAQVHFRPRALASERRRFGSRRPHILLKRECIVPNHKKLVRLYREEWLRACRRGGRKRALGTRAPMTLPQGPNQRWSLDLVADQLVDGRRFRVPVVVDDFTREGLALVVDAWLSGLSVARGLDALVETRGMPLTIVSDNGTEFPSPAILQGQGNWGVEWHYIARPMLLSVRKRFPIGRLWRWSSREDATRPPTAVRRQPSRDACKIQVSVRYQSRSATRRLPC
jgi:putative transposase